MFCLRYCVNFLLARIADGSLLPQQGRADRYTERRAGNVGEANVVAELDGSRVAAVLAADTKLDVRAGGLTELASHLNELAYANLVELCERDRSS